MLIVVVVVAAPWHFGVKILNPRESLYLSALLCLNNVRIVCSSLIFQRFYLHFRIAFSVFFDCTHSKYFVVAVVVVVVILLGELS